jgi:hypothetical protein
VIGRVVDELGVATGDKRELAPVRSPARPRHRGRIAAFALKVRDQPRRRCGLRRDDVETELIAAVRIFAALAEERDLLAVGRPRWPAFVVAARRQELRFAAGDVEHI